ncbi:MAG: TetR/AcrR family transcriptional regulator [Bacteriovoracaceae bacterium]
MIKKKSKGELTKERIVSEAIGLMANHGFVDTTFQMIADKIELTQASIFKHYPTKKELFRGILSYILQTNHQLVSGRLNSSMNAKERLFAHCEGNIAWAKKYPEQAQMILLLYYYGTHDEELRATYCEILSIGQSRIDEYLQAGLREKLIKVKSQELELYVGIFHELLMGMIINIISTPKKLSDLNHKKSWQKLELLYNQLS